MAKVAVFSPEDARMVLDAARYLRANGFAIDGGKKKPPQQPADPANPPIHFKNDSGEEIPPYACMQITGTEVVGDRTYFVVDQPADDRGDAGEYLWNLHRAIPIGGYGLGDPGPEVVALSADSDAASGVLLSPTVSSWSLKLDTSGSIVQCGQSAVSATAARVIVSSSRAKGDRLAKTGDAIPARSGTTAGSGTVTLQKLVGTTITAETNTVTAYNFAGSEIAAGVYVWINRDERGNWWVTAEDCSGVE